MNAPTAQIDDIATAAKGHLDTAVRTWADALTTATGALTAERPASLDPATLVEKYFDFAQLVLDKQREIATSLLTAGSGAAQQVTEQAVVAAKSVAARAEAVVEAPAAPAAEKKPATKTKSAKSSARPTPRAATRRTTGKSTGSRRTTAS